MFGRSMSVEGGRGKEDVRVLSEFKEAKGGGAGVKGSKRGEVRGIEKAASSQPSPEPSSISPRKTRRSQRGRGKAKSEKQGFINSTQFVSSVRSSSVYHGLLEGSSKPLFQIFQILQIRK